MTKKIVVVVVNNKTINVKDERFISKNVFIVVNYIIFKNKKEQNRLMMMLMIAINERLGWYI